MTKNKQVQLRQSKVLAKLKGKKVIQKKPSDHSGICIEAVTEKAPKLIFSLDATASRAAFVKVVVA